VSRNTAQEVYERLAEEGLTTARHGSGTYIADPLPMVGITKPTLVRQAPDPRLNEFWLRSDISSAVNFCHETNSATATSGPYIDLRPCLIDPKFFPFAKFRKGMARELRRLETRPELLKSQPWNQGNAALRSAVADHIALTRAVPCNEEDILVTTGAQQAWALIARILVKPGETVVAVEDPGYPPMRIPFAEAGARIVPVRVDEQGLVVGELPADAGIICVCPSHQFPLGMSMSADRRKELIDFARRNRAVIIEDDYDGEFRYDGSPLDALRSAASADVVFYIGTFSKCMFPSLRLGFVVSPRWATRAMITAKNSLDWNTCLPTQLAVASFLKEGHLSHHIRQIRKIYSDRRDHLLALLNDRLKDVLEPIIPSYGMHFAVCTQHEIDTEEVSKRLLERGIRCHSLNRYFLGPISRSGFLLGYASADVQELSAAVGVLADELSLETKAGDVAKRVA
jgi:GntR family transcriptional regulator/MocR family aminotransferase